MASVENPIILPLFSSPLYRETTDFRFNPSELKTIQSVPYEHAEGPDKPVEISDENRILEKKEFKRIKNFVDKKAQDYFKKTLHIKNEFIMTQSWITKGRPGIAHHKHRHLNAIFSLVYYIDCPSAHLQFTTPDNFLMNCCFFSYEYNKHTVLNSATWTIPVKTGDLLIFPANMCHQSSPNSASANKWVLSCNYFLKEILNLSQHLICACT